MAPDSSVHVAWLDRRESPAGGSADYPGGGVHTGHKLLEGTAALYTARWKGGTAFEKNVRVAGDICPCCRAAVGFADGRVILAWRSVDRNNIRDIAVSASPDGGLTWTSPRIAVRDNWRIDGCPHVGPSLATAGNTLYLAWMTRGKRDSGVFVTSSRDGGLTFGTAIKVSGRIENATRPYLAAGADYAAVVFQGSTERETATPPAAHGAHAGHAPASSTGAFIALLEPRGAVGAPAGIPGKNLSYPFAAIHPGGEIAIAWTQTENDRSTGWLTTGRAPASRPNQGMETTRRQ